MTRVFWSGELRVFGLQGAASDDINSVCTSNTGNIIVSADDHGHVNLFNYPRTTQGASPVVGKGHSSHVMNVRFSHAKGAEGKNWKN